MVLAGLLTLQGGALAAHEIGGGSHFMCRVQPPEAFSRAEAGDPVAQYQVGHMLDFCPPEDPAAAAGYFLRAAQQGEIRSALRIGRMYMFGIGVTRDDREAYFWLAIGKRLFDAALRPPDEFGPRPMYVEADLALLEKQLPPNEIREIRSRVIQWEPAPESRGSTGAAEGGPGTLPVEPPIGPGPVRPKPTPPDAPPQELPDDEIRQLHAAGPGAHATAVQPGIPAVDEGALPRRRGGVLI
jgi:hypothetical protein